MRTPVGEQMEPWISIDHERVSSSHTPVTFRNTGMIAISEKTRLLLNPSDDVLIVTPARGLGKGINPFDAWFGLVLILKTIY